MLSFMITGPVQEPSRKQLDHYFPDLDFFLVKSKYFDSVQSSVKNSESLEELQEKTKQEVAGGEDFFNSLNFMEDEEVEGVSQLILDGDFDAAYQKSLSIDNLGELITKYIGKLYNTILAYSILNKNHAIIDKCKDYVKIFSAIKKVKEGALRELSINIDNTEELSEVQIDVVLFSEFLFRVNPRIEIVLPKLKKSKVLNSRDVREIRATGQPPADSSVENIRANRNMIGDLQYGIYEVEEVIRKKGRDDSSNVQSKEDYIRSLQVPDDIEMDSYEKYHASAAREVLNDGDFKSFSKRTGQVFQKLGFSPNNAQPKKLIEELTFQIEKYSNLMPVQPAISPEVYFSGYLIEIENILLADLSCSALPRESHCELLKRLAEKHSYKPQLKVLGLGSAYRVDTKFNRYLRGELVHTETVLSGSTKKSDFRKLNRVEVFEETFSSTEEQKETEVSSEDRFKLEKEVESETNKKRDEEFGVSISASYGEVLSVSANYGVSSSTANKEKSKQAKELAQNKISKAVANIRKKDEQRKSTKRTNETERNNSFEIINTSKPSFTAYYFSIDKEYKNELICLGKRLMVRVYIQQPMAFLLHCLSNSKSGGVVIDKPIAPDKAIHPVFGVALKKFTDITPANYPIWGSFFETADLPLPPAHNLTASARTQGNNASTDDWPNGGGTIPIPEGYIATSVSITVMISGGSGRYIAISVGNTTNQFYHSGYASSLLNNETNEISWSHRGNSGTSFTVHVTVECQPAKETLDKWRSQVYDAIWTDYRRKKSDYDSEVESLKLQAGIAIGGTNPRKNEMLIREELYKMVMGAAFPKFYYLGMDSMKFGMSTNPDGSEVLVPEPDFSDALQELPWVTFISQVFEYENITYKFHPYYNAIRKNWCSLRNITNSDPKLEAAFNAGGVTIDVPVRKNFENSFMHYFNTGEIWGGNDMPCVGDPLYQAIALEVKDSDIKDGLPCSDESPWTTVLPTDLVMVDDNPPPDL